MPINDDNQIKPSASSSFGIILPCEPTEFGEFISSLLGKPQTIERRVVGAFEVSKQDIANIFHLIEQRIHQQNDAALMQFTVRILYDDDSSILLNSLSDFQRYSEIRPITSIGVVLSWVYLVQFKNKAVPERQEINISFGNHADGMFFLRKALPIRLAIGIGGILIRIQHTERTWGADIENLLAGHVKNLIKEVSKKEEFLWKNSGMIGFGSGVVLFLSALLGVVITSSKFIEVYLAKVNDLLIGGKTADEILTSKIDFVVEIISTGVWPRFTFSIVVFLIISLILAIILGSWIGSKADNRPESFVLLSKKAEEKRSNYLAERKRDWLMFSVSILASIGTGVIANLVFSTYFL